VSREWSLERAWLLSVVSSVEDEDNEQYCGDFKLSFIPLLYLDWEVVQKLKMSTHLAAKRLSDARYASSGCDIILIKPLPLVNLLPM
jgi:hypothetical protein